MLPDDRLEEGVTLGGQGTLVHEDPADGLRLVRRPAGRLLPHRTAQFRTEGGAHHHHVLGVEEAAHLGGEVDHVMGEDEVAGAEVLEDAPRAGLGDDPPDPGLAEQPEEREGRAVAVDPPLPPVHPPHQRLADRAVLTGQHQPLHRRALPERGRHHDRVADDTNAGIAEGLGELDGGGARAAHDRVGAGGDAGHEPPSIRGGPQSSRKSVRTGRWSEAVTTPGSRLEPITAQSSSRGASSGSAKA